MEYGEDGKHGEPLTAAGYIAWAGRTLNEESRFSPLRESFPELLGPARKFDECFATINMGAAVIFAFKRADGMSYADISWHMRHLLDLVPKPGAVDALEYTGILVLVFEKPLDPGKRDQYIALKERRFLRRGFAQVVIVELDAGALWTADVPRVIRPLVGYLSEAIGKRGEAPPLKVHPPLVGQSGSRTGVALVAIALVALLSAIHLGVELAPDVGTWNLRLYRFGARHAAAVANGESWRLVTGMFLHGSWDHLIGNVIGLFEYARGVEPLFGSGWLLALFVITGFVGMLLSHWFSGASLAIGASGAVFGLAGVLASVYLFRKERLTMRFRAHIFGAAILASGYSIWKGFQSPLVDNWGHVGGFVSGFIIGVILPFKEGDKAKWGGKWWGWAALALTVKSSLGVLDAWDPDKMRFTPVHWENLKVNISQPVCWYSEQLAPTARRAAGVEYYNGTGAEVTLTQRHERIDWMLVPTLTREQQLEGNYNTGKPESWQTSLDGTEDTWLGGAKAVKVSYTMRYRGRVYKEGTDYLVPHVFGFLHVTVQKYPGDGEYYSRIIPKMLDSLRILDPPIERQAEAPRP